jgi:HAD superfamily hydrolase (TIGR01509 family)
MPSETVAPSDRADASAEEGITLPSAVLWDFDGTLVDSQPYWTATWLEMAERRGGLWNDEYSLALVGLDLLDAGRYLGDHLGVADDPAQLVAEMVEGVIARIRQEVPWRAGARELLTAIRTDDIPCALVTMSYRSLVEPVLEQLATGTFDAVITGDEVSHGKPHPAPYLTAAAALGVDPRDCLAIEDSPTGVASASAAGCRVIVAPNHGPIEAGRSGVPVEGLVGLAVADLQAAMARG